MNIENKNQHILIIDDEKELLEVMSDILTIGGWKTTTFTSGLDALAFLEQKEGIDLVLSDIKMPIINGIELTKKIKNVLPQIPIILMTGHLQAMPEEIENLDVEILFKPIDWNVLHDYVEKALS